MSRRILLGLAAAIIAAVTFYLGAMFSPLHTASATRITPHVASCANSYPNDGHAGPYHTGDNGGTLHGNTVHTSCPSPSTHWDVTYTVQLVSNGQWETIMGPINRSGNGSPLDWSVQRTQDDCNQSIYAFPLRTHIVNNVTGGTINKPSGGAGVHICGN